MLLGVDYYPEQWSDFIMEDDMERIIELGSNVIRIGEFAWHRMEPKSGEYDFSYFDKVIEMAKKKGLNVIFGTPTATPPAWLIKQYPDIRSEFADGSPRVYGGRHTFCFNSDTYIEYCKKIITKLVEHYKDEKAIIAWQIDNELGHEDSDICWCPKCHIKFQNYLKERFNGDINALNDEYGTAFWSQEYNDFNEIPLPNNTITTHNPALRLDWERFRSKSLENFAQIQVDLIHSIIPDAVVMHDFPGGGLNKHADYSMVAQSIDKVAYNNYPVWGGQKKPLPANEIAFGLDYIRGLRGENFWITEAIMGAQGHDITGFLPRPNQAKMWSWQGVARGCDGLMYFRYRGATKGAEQFCYGILDADNQPRRRFYEVQSFFKEVKPLEKYLTTPVESDIAILYDYDSLSSFRIQQQSILLDCETEMKRLHKVFFEAGQMVDVIPARRDFSKYKIVVVPNMIVTDAEFMERLTQYTKSGGCVIVTYRTAIKDRSNNLTFGKPIPVDAQELLGLWIDETESVQEYDCIKLCSDNDKATAGIFRDMIVTTTAKTLYKYNDTFYKQYSAITKNELGKGQAYYIGTTPDYETLKKVLTDAMLQCDIKHEWLPEGLELVYRKYEDKVISILINHNDFDVKYEGTKLNAFEVKVLEKN